MVHVSLIKSIYPTHTESQGKQEYYCRGSCKFGHISQYTQYKPGKAGRGSCKFGHISQYTQYKPGKAGRGSCKFYHIYISQTIQHTQEARKSRSVIVVDHVSFII